MASATAKSCSREGKSASSWDNARVPTHIFPLRSSGVCRSSRLRSRLTTPNRLLRSKLLRSKLLRSKLIRPKLIRPKLPLRTTLPPNSTRWRSARQGAPIADLSSRTLTDALTRTSARMSQSISRKLPHKSLRQFLSATPSAITESARRSTASTLTAALQPSPQLKRSNMASSF